MLACRVRRIAVAALAAACVSVGAAPVAAANPAAAQATTGHYIVALEDGVSEQAAAAQGARQGALITAEYRTGFNGYAADLSPAAFAALERDPLVMSVTPERAFRLVGPARIAHRQRGRHASKIGSPVDCPSGIIYRQCLGHAASRIEADRSSARSGDHAGDVPINVAVIDSGVDPTHLDLNVAGGVDCSSGVALATGYEDQFGHGTFVAGVIGARDNGIGIVGIVPGARIWSMRVVDDQGEISEAALICAVNAVSATRVDSDPTNDIAVANVSIGGDADQADGHCGPKSHDPLHRAICISTGLGVTYVVSAGNDAADFANTFPAAYGEVLTATAMADFNGRPGGGARADCYGIDLSPSGIYAPFGDFDDQVASFSNFATRPADAAHTVAAPGVCVDSLAPVALCEPDNPHPGECYAFADGTSFSSPLTAGTVALCIAAGECGGLAPPQIIRKIVGDAEQYSRKHPWYGFKGDPLRPAGAGYYGFLIRAGLY